MWQAFAMAGIKGIMGYSQASTQRKITAIENKVAAANADNANRVRSTGNAFEAAKGSLSRYLQSVNNNRTLEAGGEALEQNLINARRQEDTELAGDFETAIRSAEQNGAQAAAAAFAGVGGEVADNISMATKLMQQRAQFEAQKNQDFRLYDYSRRAATIQTQTIRSLDSSLIFDALDYGTDVAQKKYSQNPWSAGFMAAGESLLGSAAGGAFNSTGGGFSNSGVNPTAKFTVGGGYNTASGPFQL
jgi:hypothetical protein